MNKFFRDPDESSIVARITLFACLLRIINIDQTLMIVSLLLFLLHDVW